MNEKTIINEKEAVDGPYLKKTIKLGPAKGFYDPFLFKGKNLGLVTI